MNANSMIDTSDPAYLLGQHCAMVTINRRPGIVRDEIARVEQVLTGIGQQFIRYHTPRNYLALRGYYTSLMEYEGGKD